MELVVKIIKLVGIHFTKNDISTAHRLRPKRYTKISEPPAIIAKSINRNLCNLIYSKSTAARQVPKEDFPVPGTKNLSINENLT